MIFFQMWKVLVFFGTVSIKMVNLTSVIDGHSLEVNPHFLPRTKNKYKSHQSISNWLFQNARPFYDYKISTTKAALCNGWLMLSAA